MNRSFQIFAYVFSIIIGGLLLVFRNGHIDVFCIKCNSWIVNLFSIVAIVTGIVGLLGTIASGKALANGR